MSLLMAFTLLVSSCDAQSNHRSDAILQRLYESGQFQIDENNYSLFELQGPVKSVSYFSEKIALPLETITFYTNGELNEVEYSDWGGETIHQSEMEFDDKNRLTSLTGELFEAHFTYHGKSRNPALLKIYDQEGGLYSYSFLYDQNNKLNTVKLYREWWYDYENQVRRNETIRYAIKDLAKDDFGNWTKREIRSDLGEVAFVTREIKYVDPPKPLSIESKNSFFCYTVNDFDSIFLYRIDKQTHSLVNFIPPESNIIYLGYKAIEVVGDRLYAIIYTGACGAPGNDCKIYYYDTSKESWHYIITCGEECQFIDGWIKAPVFTLTKEGNCTANNEYAETIKWIKLER